MAVETKAFKELFPSEHIADILVSVIEASADIYKRTETDREDWITQRLYNRLVKIYPFRDGPLDITKKPETSSLELDANTPEGELDLRVSCGRGHEIYFAMEAKRLRVRNSDGTIRSGNSEYVDEGMMRFVKGQYAPFMKVSAMLGYVFDGDIDKARSGIDKSVRGKTIKLKLKAPKQLIRSKILSGKPVDETRHDLDKRIFTIYHVFLSVSEKTKNSLQ